MLQLVNDSSQGNSHSQIGFRVNQGFIYSRYGFKALLEGMEMAAGFVVK